jgi:hypothetical protein
MVNDHVPLPEVTMRFTCLIALTGLLFGGCAKQQKIGALSEVAKGWCRTIRASQVIPVYPLTEDVQVGDLFVVQRPIEAEAQVYEEAGFLPLGIHLARLFPSHEYHNFYQDGAYGVVGTEVKANASQPSKVRSTDPALREVEARKYPPMVWQPSNGQEQPNQTEWAKAPRASFPSYGFRIQNSGGIDAALPIQGIPVGLTLLGAEEASASVTLADAFTYGLGTAELARYVRDWSTVSENREALKRYEPVYELDQQQNEYRIRYNFLRVVTRVYLNSSP